MTKKVLERDSKEYKKLEIVAKMLELQSPNNFHYFIRDIYFDFGIDWKWTTICSAGAQILSPKDWEDIMMADIDGLAEIVKRIRNGKYFSDK